MASPQGRCATAGEEPAPRTCEVLVVGAGPTGLTLACDLRRRGIDVHVVEARTEPATTSRAFALHPRGLEILEDVGVTGLGHRAQVVRHATSHAAHHPLAHLHFDRLARSGHPGIYLISQAEIEAELRANLERLGGHVDLGTELTGLVGCRTPVSAPSSAPSSARDRASGSAPSSAPSSAPGVHATVRHVGSAATSTLHASWVVGCDGANSSVRDLVGLRFEGRSLPETFLLADLELADEPGDDDIRAHLHPDGILGLFPLPDEGVYRLIAQLDEGAEVPDDDDEVAPLAQDLLLRRADPDLEVARCIWSSRFRIHRRLATRYRTGRVLIAGDAAHVHSPFGGQGMNVGLGDATNLGWKLAAVVRGDATEALLDTYGAERRPVARAIVARTTIATRFATSPGHPLALVRDRVLPTLARWRASRPTRVTLPRAAVEWFTQLRVSYRDGPLGASADPSAAGASRRARHARYTRYTRYTLRVLHALRVGPLPGDRVPDGPVRRAGEAAPTHLRAITRGEWALLVFGGHRRSRRPGGATSATVREVVRHHLGEVTTVVVHPRGAGGPAAGRRTTGTEAASGDEAASASEHEHAHGDRHGDRHGHRHEGRHGQRHGARHGGRHVAVEDSGLARVLGARPGELLLVRPDGHLGWRSHRPGPPLASWLRRAMPRARPE